MKLAAKTVAIRHTLSLGRSHLSLGHLLNNRQPGHVPWSAPDWWLGNFRTVNGITRIFATIVLEVKTFPHRDLRYRNRRFSPKDAENPGFSRSVGQPGLHYFPSDWKIPALPETLDLRNLQA